MPGSMKNRLGIVVDTNVLLVSISDRASARHNHSYPGRVITAKPTFLSYERSSDF